ncbi:shikimate dehydrogenase [Mesorhizobium sp. M0088]|uniref:shikimate dehydrogenase family protein n=1 Tax=Mesorhizobium sp. M0088 TaxID=2956873 RepID=UPI00333D91EC
MAISGTTKLYPIFADPVLHVRTPTLLNARFAELGHDGIVVPYQVSPDRLASVFCASKDVASIAGFVATIPHKSSLATLCDVVTERAHMIGAVNVVRRLDDGRLQGDMLDGPGFVKGLETAGIPFKGKSVAMAGAGGAARAIAFELISKGAGSLSIRNRNRHAAEELRSRLLLAFPHADVSVDDGQGRRCAFDLLVNGTSLGMRECDPLPFSENVLRGSGAVCEVVMVPEITPLLKAAQKAGVQIHRGEQMLTGQIEAMSAFFTDTL